MTQALKVSALVPQDFEAMKADLAGDKAYCAVIALAAITGVPVKTMQELLAKAGRKPRCGTSRSVQEKVLKQLGYKVIKRNRVWIRKQVIDTYPGRHCSLESATTHHPRRFRNSAWSTMPNCLIFVPNHVLAFVSGQVVDWTVKHSKRIEEMWFIEKEGE